MATNDEPSGIDGYRMMVSSETVNAIAVALLQEANRCERPGAVSPFQTHSGVRTILTALAMLTFDMADRLAAREGNPGYPGPDVKN